MRRLKLFLKRFIFKIPFIAEYHKWFLSIHIGQRFTNFIFKVVFSQNRGCPWSIHYTSRITDCQKIKIGIGVEISLMISGGCYIQGLNGIEIGDGTIIASGVKIIAQFITECSVI